MNRLFQIHKILNNNMKKKNILAIGIVTILILLIPLVAMQFTNEVNWSVFDFIIMGALLFGTGLTYEFISSRSGNIVYKSAVGIAVAAGLLLIWINLAVGIIGSEGNPANLLYAGVLLTGIVGALMVRFRSGGMARTLFITAFLQALVPLIALIFWKDAFNELPGFGGIFLLNSVFAVFFAVSGYLFMRADGNLKGKKLEAQTQ